MFFMIGITDGQKDLDFNQVITCPICSAMGSYRVFMTYTVLSLFFIPCFKWNRRYYVKSTCCDAIYELDPEIGKRISRGEHIEIRRENLTRVLNQGHIMKRCSSYGYSTEEDFEFCPKCGNRF